MNWTWIGLYITFYLLTIGIVLLVRSLVLLMQQRNPSSLPVLIGIALVADAAATLVLGGVS